MNHWLASSAHGLRTLAALMLLLTTLFGAATSVADARQVETSTVLIFTTENGQSVYDTCYVLGDFSDVACHENGNGYVAFPGVSVGTYTVRQVADLGANRHVDDFTIEVTGMDDPAAPYPGIEMFSTEVISSPGGSTGSGSTGTSGPAEPSAPTDAAVTTESTGTTDPMSLLPTIADVPGGLVETGRRTRSLEDVAGNYTDPAETTRLFTNWGWQGNAVASFALPSGQQAQSGQVNGVYVSIHQFAGPDEARAALDFSLTEQAAGTVLQEVPISPIGEHSRALYGPMDYGNETTVLTQQGGVFIRVSVAMLDGDPTADAISVTEAILLKATAQQTTTIEASSGEDATTGSQGGNAQETWTASVQVNLCDAPPGSGSDMNCQAGPGVTVDISLASGEWMGSCSTGDPQPTPWDTTISLCTVEGLPFNAGFVATQNPSTIPAGYAPFEDPLSLRVGDLHPGGGDQATFTFFNVRADAGSTGSVITSDTGGSTEATLLMTFRGCPEGFDPNTGDFFAECAEPLDAPDNAFLEWGGDGQGGMYITQLDRQYNGAYIHAALSDTMNLRLLSLAPVVRDAYQVTCADGANGDAYTISLVDRETREVFVFYYYE